MKLAVLSTKPDKSKAVAWLLVTEPLDRISLLNKMKKRRLKAKAHHLCQFH